MADPTVYDPSLPQAVSSSPPSTSTGGGFWGGVGDFLQGLGHAAMTGISGLDQVIGHLPLGPISMWAMGPSIIDAKMQRLNDLNRLLRSQVATDPRYLSTVLSGSGDTSGSYFGGPFSIFPTTPGGPGANLPQDVQDLLLSQVVPGSGMYKGYQDYLAHAHASAIPSGVPLPVMYPELAQSYTHQAQAGALQQNPFLGGNPFGLPPIGWSFDPKTGALRVTGGIPPPPVQTEAPYQPPPAPTGETPQSHGGAFGGGVQPDRGVQGLSATERPSAGGRGIGRGLAGQTYTWTTADGQTVTGTVDQDGMRVPQASDGRPWVMALDANGKPVAIDAGAAQTGNIQPTPATQTGQTGQQPAGGKQPAGSAAAAPPAPGSLADDEQQLERLRPPGRTGNPPPAFLPPGEAAGGAVGQALGGVAPTPPVGRLQAAASAMGSALGPASAEAAGPFEAPAEPAPGMVTRPGETIGGGGPQPGQRQDIVGGQEKAPKAVSELRKDIGDAINTYPWLRTSLQNKYKTNNVNSIQDATLEHDDLAIAAAMTIKLQRQLDLALAKGQLPAPAELAQSRQAAATKQLLQQMLITPVGKNAAGQDVIPLDASPRTGNPFVTIGQTGELLSAHGGVPGWLGALMQLGGPGGPGVPGAPPGMWSVVQMSNAGGVMGQAAANLLQASMLAINMAKALGASGRINQRELDILMNVAIPSPSSTYQRNVTKFQNLMRVLDDVISEVNDAQLHAHIEALDPNLGEAIPKNQDRALVGRQGTAIPGTLGKVPQPNRSLAR